MAQTQSTPRYPRRICLLNTASAGETNCATVLLDDFAEALPVYAKYDLPKDATRPKFARAWEETTDKDCDTGVDVGDGTSCDTSCDVLVIGHLVESGALGEDFAMRLKRLSEDGALADDALVYALVVTDAHDAGPAESALCELARLAAMAGLTWNGGISIGGGAMVTPTADSPRMGWLRRRRSETIDHLIWYVLGGMPAPEGMRARCPLPRFVYRHKYLR